VRFCLRLPVSFGGWVPAGVFRDWLHCIDADPARGVVAVESHLCAPSPLRDKHTLVAANDVSHTITSFHLGPAGVGCQLGHQVVGDDGVGWYSFFAINWIVLPRCDNKYLFRTTDLSRVPTLLAALSVKLW
jgi:hypothetical protein